MNSQCPQQCRTRCGHSNVFPQCLPGPQGVPGPQGLQGPVGAIGPAGSLAVPLAFGGGFTPSPGVDFTLAASANTIVPLSQAMDSDTVQNTPADSLTITQSGIYRVAYNITGTDLLAAAQANVLLNGTAVPALQSSRTSTSFGQFLRTGTAFLSLTANDVLQLVMLNLSDSDVTARRLQDELTVMQVM